MLVLVAFLTALATLFAFVAVNVEWPKERKPQRIATVAICTLLLICIGSGSAAYAQEKSMKYQWVQSDSTQLINLATAGQGPVYAYHSSGHYCYAWRDNAGLRHDDVIYEGEDVTINDSTSAPELVSWKLVLTKVKWGWLDPGIEDSGMKFELRVPRGTIQIIADC